MNAHVKSILLVENDALDTELTLTRVAKQNLVNQVVVARNDREALDYLDQRGKFSVRPRGHAVVARLDLKFPKVHGLEVVKIIRPHEHLKAIPAVMLCSACETPALKKCYLHNEEECAVKPVDSKDLMQSIEQLGLFWGRSMSRRRMSPKTSGGGSAREGEFMASKEGA